MIISSRPRLLLPDVARPTAYCLPTHKIFRVLEKKIAFHANNQNSYQLGSVILNQKESTNISDFRLDYFFEAFRA